MKSLNDFEQHIDALYQQFKEHDAGQLDRLTKYRNIEPESAKLLSILIRAQQSKNVLEIGTSTGYSTLWLAQALQDTQGKLTTIEIDPERSEQAQLHTQKFGVDGVIEFYIGDALTFLRESIDKFDFILLDAERDQYVEYWPYLGKLLKKKGGMLVVDNVISHVVQVNDFIQLVEKDQNFISTTINVGAGLFLVTLI